MHLSDRDYMEYIVKTSSQYQMYFNDIKGICISRFKWNDIPQTMDSRCLELSLFTGGKALVCRDDVIGLINLDCSSSSDYDIYGNPYGRVGYSMYTPYNIETNSLDSVIIWNNVNRMPSLALCDFYATSLATIDLTLGVNINAQKTPVLLVGQESQVMTLKNLYMQYDGFAPVIYGNPDFDFNKISCVKTDAPFIADKLREIKEGIWAEMLTRLGVPSVQYEKKERMVADEIKKSLGGTTAFRNYYMREREIACERINEMFGTEISVSFNEEVEGFGELYNASQDDM